MKVRLLDPGGKIPNLAIMKISTYHKRLGHDVGWYEHMFDYKDTDLLYISKVFAFTPDVAYLPINAKIERGGTGYDIFKKLPEEIESIKELDYSLYPDCEFSILFTSRGCVRNCEFCIVPEKEGLIHDVPIAELNPNGKYIQVLDNNFFANKNWRKNIEILKGYNQHIDFNQGIDLRLLTEEQCEAIASLKTKRIHCAWDSYKDKDFILPKLKMLLKYVKGYKIMVYVLVGFENRDIVDTDIERVMTLKDLGVDPFAIGYRDFNNPNHEISRSVKDFMRWCNRKPIFKTTSWEDYKR